MALFLVILIFKYQMLESTRRREAREKEDDLWNTLNSSDGPEEAYRMSWLRSLNCFESCESQFFWNIGLRWIEETESLHFSQVPQTTVFFLLAFA